MADNAGLASEIVAAGRAAGLDIDANLVAFTIGYVAATTDTEDILIKNISAMNRLAGYDVVIVCCSNQSQEDYWQRRLETVRGQVMPLDSVVLAVHEDWPGGAGNGLGTLYACVRAGAVHLQLCPWKFHDAVLPSPPLSRWRRGRGPPSLRSRLM